MANQVVTICDAVTQTLVPVLYIDNGDGTFTPTVNGTINASGALTVGNGADVTEGNTADAGVVGDNVGTVSAKLRGLNTTLSSLNTTAGTLALETGGNLATTATNTGHMAQTYTRSDTYITTGPGVTIDAHLAPSRDFSLQVNVTGAGITTWTVVIEASLDNVNWTTILTHTHGTNAAGSIVNVAGVPAFYFRSNCTALTLNTATNVIATILAMR